MPRGVTREYTVTYNTLTMGGSDEKYRVTGFTRIRQEPEVGQVEWDVLVVGSTEAAFSANCRDFEEKMSEPWNDFSFKQGNSSLVDVAVSDNTALNPEVTVQKVGTTTDTGRTRRYHCSATWGRPADYPNAESVGLRDYDVQVSFTPARRRSVSIVGTYTAVTDNLARAQYEAKIEAFATAVLTAIDAAATFEIVEEDASHDINNKTLTFSRIYDEVIFGQGGSSKANVNIVSQTLEISAGRLGAEAHPNHTSAEALGNISLRYSAWFDKDQTTSLESQYDSIKEWLITQAEEYASGSYSLALVEETPAYDPVENKISVTMRFRAGNDYGAYFEVRFTTEDNVDYGLAAVHAWGGGAFDKYIYQAEANVFRTIRMTMLKSGELDRGNAESEFVRFAGSESAAGSGGGGNGNTHTPPSTDPIASAGGKWFSQGRKVSADPYFIGISGNQIKLTRMTGEAVRFWAKPIEDSPITGGGGGGPITPS